MLFVAGGDDQLGDSARMAAVGMRWLRDHRIHPQPDEVAYYSDAGHLISHVLQPTTFRHQTGPHIAVGGTPQGHARADQAASQRVLGFISAALAE